MPVEFINSFLDNLFDRRRYSNVTRNLLPPSIQVWGKKEAVWLDTGEAWRLFIEIPELRTVISKRASMMSSNIPKLYDKSGNIVEKHWLLDLINHPNAVQSWSDVVYAMSVQDALYSNVVAYCPKRSFDIRNLMVVLPNNKVTINLSGKRLKQMDKEDLIESFVFKYDDGTKEKLEWTDTIYLTTADGMNIVKPISRIDSLKFPLSNIQAAYNKRNVLLENLGAIGILSAQNSDMGGAIPMTPEERNKIQKDWYMRQKDEIMITESNVTWNPMSYPTRELMLFEELSADIIAIVDAYGMNMNIFSSEKGSTFSNVRESMKMVYQDTIIPETQQMYDSIMHQFDLTKDGYYLEACFDHLPILQEDESSKIQTQKAKLDLIMQVQSMGVPISQEDIKNVIDM